MKDWWKIAFSVACSLLGAGLIILISSRPRGQPISLLPPPTPAPIVVHVVGAVAQPGVYSFPPESRVQDAVRAAGGPSSEADLQALNLADFLQDGSRLFIPTLPPVLPAEGTNPIEKAPPTSEPSRGGETVPIEPGPDHLININTATQTELESLPGIGPVLAQRIIAYREANGSFKTIQDIIKVSGIASKTFELIKNLITVEPSS